MRALKCLRCNALMRFLMREKFQKGESGAWVGNLNFNFRGGFEMDVYSCGKCGRLEFFLPYDQPENGDDVQTEDTLIPGNSNITHISADGIPQVRCPACGKTHDFDHPQCPHCDHKYHL